MKDTVPMQIALVAPLAEAVPPKLYGGTERVVYWLGEELVKLGHRVVLFASGDSDRSAELAACSPQGLRLAGIRDHLGSTLAMLREVRQRANEFDIIHFHVDLLPQALFHDLSYKCLVTLHGRLDLPDAFPLYQAYPEMPLISISNAQRRPMPPMPIGSPQFHMVCSRTSASSIRKAASIWLSSGVSHLKSVQTAQLKSLNGLPCL
jgi:glycosyltransferase involved in cell wall biosynthesis